MPSRKPPVYHRLGDDPALIETIRTSGELMGSVARNTHQSHILKVKAFMGPLPKGEQGFAFTTPVAPDPGHVPDKPTWREGRPGVRVRRIGNENFAAIPCTILKVQ